MAITVIQSLSLLALYQKNTPIIAELSSDNTSEAGFQFVADVYIEGSLVGRMQKPPVVNLNRCYFDFRTIVSNYLELKFSSLNYKDHAGANIQLEVHYGEYYNATYYTSLAINTIRVQPTQLDYETYFASSINPLSYYLLGGTSRWLTNQKTRTLTTDSSAYLYGQIPAKTVDEIQIDLYNASGTLLSSPTISIIQSEVVFSVGVGPVNLKNQLGFSVLDNVAYYKVSALASSSRVSEYIQINLSDKCSRFDTYTLHFQNELGGYDSFDFTMLSRESRESEVKGYKLKGYGYNGGAFEFTRQTSKPFHSNTKESILLNSDFITDAEALVLKSLFNSHDTWLERNGVFSPVVVQEKSYIKRTTNNDDLIQYAVNVTKSYEIKKW